MARHETSQVIGETRREAVTHRNKVDRLLLAGGMIGPILFSIVFIIEGATRPGYDAWLQAVSSLSLSDQGWEQIANFLVCGLLLVGFGIGLRRALPTGRGSTWGPLLVAIAGLGLVCAGIFVTDPAQGYPAGTPSGPAVVSTLHGTLHFALGATGFFGMLPIASFVLARYFAGRAGWNGWAAYSIVTGLLMYVSFVGFIMVGIHSGPAGLYERVAISIGMLWLVFLAARLLMTRSSIVRATEAMT